MTQNELTQMADSLDDSASFLSPSIGSKSRQREDSPPPRINLRNVPWARLIPCSELGNASVRIGAVAAAGLRPPGAAAVGGGSNSNSPIDGGGGGFCRNDATGITLYPRDPLDAATASSSTAGAESSGTPTRRNPAGRNFLGLGNLQPSDRFNEFTVGRSLKCDLITTAQPKDSVDGEAQTAVEEGEDPGRAQSAARKRDRNSEWVHSTISNKHCKIFCHLKSSAKGGANGGGRGAGGGGGATGGRGHFAGIANQGEEMEVYLEDTSGNGTAINNTTVLRRGERRVLHTGDEICLINPDNLRKQSNAIGTEEQGRLVRHYSYIFVNLYQQRGQHTLALGGEFGMRGAVQASGGSNRRAVYNSGGKVTPKPVGAAGAASSGVSSSARRRGVVDVRAVKTSQDMDDRAVMPPPPSAQRKAAGGSGGGAASSLFSSAVLNQASAAGEKRSRQLAQAKGQNQAQAQAQAQAPAQQYPQQQPQHPPPPPRPRLVQDHYDVRDHLGSGTCGEVRRAIHRRTGREYAIKIIPTSNRGGRMAAMKLQMSDAAIKAEAAILQALDHPYIVKLVDVFVAPNQAVYLVMELLHGGDLFDRIVEKERYEEAEARKVMRRILAALYYLHETKEICHRDLKPENILMVGHSDNITVKLTDFGLAKSVTEEGLKTFCGTPSYIAPEVLKRRHTVAGQGRYGKEADMWSIGVILYILLSGTPPFDTSGSIDNVFDARISFDDDRGWFGVSDAAKDLVRRLLVNNPIQRLTVEGACNHAWILQEDGDTHCHPLNDPAVEGVEKPKPKSNSAPVATLAAKNASFKPSESRQSRLQFSLSTTSSAGNRSQPQASATHKASKGSVQQAPVRRMKQERLKPIPILKSATKAKRPNKKQAALSIIEEEAARPSPRSIAGGNTSADDSSAVGTASSCKTANPTSELPDDEILSDFSDEENGDVSKSKKTSRTDKADDSIASDPSNGTDKEKQGISKSNSGQNLVQKTLDGKTAPSPAHDDSSLVRSATADSTSSASGKRKRGDVAIDSNASSGTSPDAPSSVGSKKVQRTLFGKLASPQPQPPPEVTDGPDTTDEEKTPDGGIGGKKQKTLASFFKGKGS